MAQTEAHKIFKAQQQKSLKFVAETLEKLRVIDERIKTASIALRDFPIAASILPGLQSNMRKTSKMLKTLNRKLKFGESSLFLNNADAKLLTKMMRQQLRLTQDMGITAKKALAEADRMESLVIAAKQRAAREKKTET
jgi:hypothetical protein